MGKWLTRYAFSSVTFFCLLFGSGVLPASADPLGQPLPGESAAPPSHRALVLTIVSGPAILPPFRTAALQCSPLGGGTHPRTREACAALTRVGGDVSKFKPPVGMPCSLQYEPTTITAVGVWDDRFSLSSQTFGNPCLLRNALGVVGRF
ncbi:SSI family serine proteinase inhibitor [Streptosporangium vulgare]|uniref:SSI family serine proteinase inhibitor n=1 Tax=Streptosporangium vulgare TaxID=46190 RepID=A0ABV5TI27_9ACTN